MGGFFVVVGTLAFLVGVVALVVGLLLGLLRRPVRKWMRWKPALGIAALGVVAVGVGGALMPPAEQTAETQQQEATPAVRPTPPAVEEAEAPVEVEEPEEQPQGSQDLAQQETPPPAAPLPEVKRVNVGLFLVRCRNAVKEQLKSPNSAKFPSSLDLNAAAREFEDGSWALGSHVDAQNTFGAEVRSQFTCTYNPSTEAVTAKLTE